MKRGAALLVLSLLFTLYIQAPSGGGGPSREGPALDPYLNPYLYYAESGARWLMSIAMEPAPGLYKWYNSDLESDRFMTEQTMGAVGVGKFFLELYDATGNGTYLEYAQGTGRWLISLAEEVSPDSCRWSKYEGWGMYDPDYLGGIGSTIEYLSMLYRSTGNSTYLEYAVKGANWLIGQAVPEQNGYKWRSFSTIDHNMTGWYHGTAGLSHVLMRIHSDTGNETYLEYALGGAAWLMSMAMDMAPGEKAWVRVEGDPNPNLSWCGGTIGIVQFFLGMWETTGSFTYLEHAMAGANWTIGQGTEMGEGMLSIEHNNILCHGDPSQAIVLFSLHNATGDHKYLDAAQRIMNWIMHQRVEVNLNELKWPHLIGGSEYITGLLMGNSGIGHTFITSHRMTGNETYLDYAIKSSNWVMNMSEEVSPGAMRWNYKEGIDDTAEYCPGWYWGVAGIGQFLLEMAPNWISPEKVRIEEGETTAHGDPGTEAVLSLQVRNVGGSKGDMEALVIGQGNWTHVMSFYGSGMMPMEVRTLELRFHIPESALWGDRSSATIRVRSSSGSSDEATLTVFANRVRSIEISEGPIVLLADPGSAGIASIEVINRGNSYEDVEFKIASRSDHEWPVEIEHPILGMGPGVLRKVNVTMYSDPEATSGAQAGIVLGAYLSDNLYAEVEITLIINSIYRVYLEADEIPLTLPHNGDAEASIKVRNEGNAVDDISFDPVGSGEGWEAGISFNGTGMGPLEERNATLSIASVNILAPMVQNVSIIARSKGDPEAFSEITIVFTVEELVAVSLSNVPPGYGIPGSAVRYDITLTCEGNVPLEASVVASSGLDWAVSVSGGGTVSPGESLGIVVDHWIPSGTIEGEGDVLTLLVLDGSGTILYNTSVLTTALPIIDLLVQAPSGSVNATPGESLSVPLLIRNIGNAPSVVDIRMTAAGPISGSLSMNRIELLPGGGSVVDLIIAVPEGVSGEHVIVVEAVTGNVTRSVSILIHVVPGPDPDPRPEGIPALVFLGIGLALLLLLGAILAFVLIRRKRSVWDEE